MKKALEASRSRAGFLSGVAIRARPSVRNDDHRRADRATRGRVGNRGGLAVHGGGPWGAGGLWVIGLILRQKAAGVHRPASGSRLGVYPGSLGRGPRRVFPSPTRQRGGGPKPTGAPPPHAGAS